MATLVLVFKKIESEDKTKFESLYLRSKVEIIFNESDIDNVFEFIYSIKNKQKSLGKGSGGIIDSVIDHTISIQRIIPCWKQLYSWKQLYK